MNLATAAEASVVALAIAGDDDAFQELVRRRQAPTRGFLRRLCNDAALADDLAQDCFVQCWRTLHTLREPAAFGGWLKQVAVNCWLQHRRRAGLAAVPLDAENPAHQIVITADASPALDLDGALALLSDAQRLCVVLAYAEGMSHAEIVEATGLLLGTVKSHLTRGTTALRRHLAAYQKDAR